MNKNVVLFKIVREGDDLVMLYDKDEFQKMGLEEGDYMIMERVGNNGILVSKVDIDLSKVEE